MKNFKKQSSFFLCSVLLVNLFCSVNIDAQEICHKPFLDKDFQISLEGSFINRSKSRTHLDILWKHHNLPQADTFAIQLSKNDSLYFVTNGEYRTLYSTKLKATRQMALHHLKEFIGKTPIRFDDLEILANGAFLCPEDSQKTNRLSTAFSQMWFTLIPDSTNVPKLLTMFGTRSAKREIKILEWKIFDSVLLPAKIQFASKEDCGSIWVHSAYDLNNLTPKDPLLEITKKPELTTVLQLDNKLLPNISIIEPRFSSHKKSGSQSETMLISVSPSIFKP